MDEDRIPVKAENLSRSFREPVTKVREAVVNRELVLQRFDLAPGRVQKEISCIIKLCDLGEGETLLVLVSHSIEAIRMQQNHATSVCNIDIAD